MLRIRCEGLETVSGIRQHTRRTKQVPTPIFFLRAATVPQNKPGGGGGGGGDKQQEEALTEAAASKARRWKLYEDSASKLKRKARLAKQGLEEESKEFTFKPTMNTNGGGRHQRRRQWQEKGKGEQSKQGTVIRQ